MVIYGLILNARSPDGKRTTGVWTKRERTGWNDTVRKVLKYQIKMCIIFTWK